MTHVHLRPILVAAALAAGGWSLPAAAQAAPYQCVNEPRRIAIAAQPMDAALRRLSRQTRCPISQAVPIRGVRANRVIGTYTPIEALKALVRDTGLDGQAIRQGMTVVRAPRQTAWKPGGGYDCQNVSLGIDVPAIRLDAALDRLSRQTRCPISRGFPVSGLVSRPVVGTFTPMAALRAMLEGTGLGAGAINQGMEVRPAAR